MTADVLDTGVPGTRRWWPVAVLAAVLALGAGAADLRSRHQEFRALTACAARAEAASRAAVRPVEEQATYVRPALAFARESSADGLYARVAEAAAGAVPGPARAREACAEVRVSGRHGALRAARAARLASLDAELDLLRRTAADGRAWFRDPPDAARLRADAEAALAAAEPPFS